MCSLTMAEKPITVAVTPNGYADGLSLQHPSGKEFFVMPEEQTMSMENFIDRLDDTNDSNVCYIQKQNSNLIEDLPELHADIDANTLLFASDAFNKKPDAVNFWMGDKRAITSSKFQSDAHVLRPSNSVINFRFHLHFSAQRSIRKYLLRDIWLQGLYIDSTC